MTGDKYAAKRFDIQKEDDIDVAVLETIPFEYPGSATEVVYDTDEFTCVCPWTGLPDLTAAKAAWPAISEGYSSLPPNAPPVVVWTILILSSSQPNP